MAASSHPALLLYRRSGHPGATRGNILIDGGCWIRARGWALWKELSGIADRPDDPGPTSALKELLNDPVI